MIAQRGIIGKDPKVVDLLAGFEQRDQPSWLLAAT
jgi:hypothetical protein